MVSENICEEKKKKKKRGGGRQEEYRHLSLRLVKIRARGLKSLLQELEPRLQ